jgi:hypothetical protein
MPATTDVSHTARDAVGRAAMDTMAGPGHRPARPHPAPNNTPPTTSFRSSALFLGMLNSRPHAGLACFPATMM